MTSTLDSTPPIHRVIENFTHKLDSIRETMDLMMVLATAAVHATNKQYLQVLEKFGTVSEESEKSKTFSFPLQHFRAIDKAKRRNQRAATAIDVLPRTVLVAFISEFDAFLGGLLTQLLTLRPDVLNGSDRQLNYRELLAFETIDDARNHLAMKEVEAFMRESYIGQFKWLENKFGINTLRSFERWSQFIEFTERRHLFVHSDGQVSTQYVSVCRDHGLAEPVPAVGTILTADRDYLIAAYKCLYETGVMLAHVLWRKLVPDQLAEADKYLNRVIYDLLVDERFDLATRLLQFYVRLPRISSDIYRRMAVMNLAQAYKWQGNEDECARILSSEDWSACSDSFQICQAVLKSDFLKASTIMRRIGSRGDVTEHDYRDWPIFREFRESKEFQSAFLDVFGKEPIDKEVHQSEQPQKSEGTGNTVIVEALRDAPTQ